MGFIRWQNVRILPKSKKTSKVSLINQSVSQQCLRSRAVSKLDSLTVKSVAVKNSERDGNEVWIRVSEERGFEICRQEMIISD